ncbi:hypothetical protein [Methylacidimicrobium sp. B4]|uniref:hypothetical protein n=1 Tax=Methylacidimicrobium sp. B4 TaxID=2796139 RepID=UPI001A90511E|nr:hypothetical protein [Methylacidimicrobium sp. B4]QSR84698.1 hypothetical protein MacB4_11005 [Methylacidimicrobium sp. B4]
MAGDPEVPRSERHKINGKERWATLGPKLSNLAFVSRRLRRLVNERSEPIPDRLIDEPPGRG